MDQQEILWRHFSTYIDLYKHYLKVVTELSALYYAITGAILSYYFAHADQPLMVWSLALPIVMSILFAALFAWGAVLVIPMRADIYAVRDALGLRSAPETGVLSALLAISAVLMFLVASSLAYLVWRTHGA